MQSCSILAIDSAGQGCSVGVCDAVSGLTESICEPMDRGQAEALMPLVERVMARAGVVYKDLGLIVNSVGPGGFTGLRVGMSAAKAFALSLDIPVIGLSTPEILAATYFRDHSLLHNACLCVVLETRRDDFYVQCFDPDANSLSEVSALRVQEIYDFLKNETTESIVFIGDALERFQKESHALGIGLDSSYDFQSGYDAVDAGIMIDLVHGMDIQQCATGYRDLQPVYVRDASVSQPKNKIRKIS